MKRAICFLLIIVFTLSFASCGTAGVSTYDYIRLDYPMLVYTIRSQSQAIKGGAYLNMAQNDVVGSDRSEFESKVTMKCLFNESTKVLMPLCLNVSCDHGSENTECFGNIYGSAVRGCTGIYGDNVFYIREVPHEKGQKSKNTLEVIYYGLDGTIQERKEYTPELAMANGEVFDQSFFMVYGYLKYGTKIYLRICAYATGPDSAVVLDETEIEYAHWFLCYDLETKKWSTVNKKAFQFYEQNIIPNDANEDMISFTYNGIGYTINTGNGEVDIYDCAAILDRMIAEGKVPVGTMIASVYPLRDYFICITGNDRFYFKISTAEPVNPSGTDLVSVEEFDRFIYNEDLYIIKDTPATEEDVENINTGERITIGIDNKILTYFSETEKGVIFKYIEQLEDETWESETYIVKENGRDVTYWYPQKYVYVTKEDILDDNIDEPWYYDAETYSFVQR